MYRILLLIFTLISCFFSNSFSQVLNGSWRGFIDIQGTQLLIETDFIQTEDDVEGAINIPQQGASDISLEKISVTEADSVFFQFKAGPGLAEFKGLIIDSTRIEGQFHQQGMVLPFELTKK